jgi:hypothetical protein
MAERVNQYEPLFNIRGSVKYRERDIVQGGLGQMEPRGEGQAPPVDSGAEAWVATYLHQQWMLSFMISEIAQEDELYGIAGRYGNELSRSAIYTQEVQAMALLNNTSATVYSPLEGGNFPLIATNHYRIDGGTWSNKLASGADLTIESLEQALTQWHTGQLDLRGKKLAIEPMKLIVAPSDRFTADRLVNSIQRPGTANNDPNTQPVRDLEVHVMTHMIDDGRWYIQGDTEIAGWYWFNKRPITVRKETVGDGSGNMRMTCSARWSSGASHPWASFGSL